MLLLYSVSQRISTYFSFLFSEPVVLYWFVFLFSHSLLVALHPLLQSQRCIVGVHTKAVDYLAWHRSGFILMGALSHGCFCFPDESIQQFLIPRLMDVPMQHIGQRCAICPSTELTVVAENRVVHQNNFSLVVMNFRIVLDPLKSGGIKVLRRCWTHPATSACRHRKDRRRHRSAAPCCPC